jgi:hypothetical protein
MEVVMRSTKNSRRLVVNDTVYRWKVDAGYDNDGVKFTIFPFEKRGAIIQAKISWQRRYSIDISPRLMRHAVDYAIQQRGYDAERSRQPLNLGFLDDKLNWQQYEQEVADYKLKQAV